MSRLGRFWNFWVLLFSERESGESLALFRIGLGLVILYSLLSAALGGMVEIIWFDKSAGGMRALGGNWVLQYFGGPKPDVVWAAWSVAFVSSLLFTLGLGGAIVHRAITLMLLLSYNSLITINPFASGSYDMLTTNGLFMLFWARPSFTLSLDARVKEGHWTRQGAVMSWPRYLLILQMLEMYGFAGWEKTSSVWTPAGGYSALWYVTQDWTWTRFDFDFLAWTTPLLWIGTAITWHWEQLSPLLLLWFHARRQGVKGGRFLRWVGKRDARWLWIPLGLALHINILLVMNVGPFSWISMAYYILLLNSEEWRRVYAWLGASRLRSRFRSTSTRAS